MRNSEVMILKMVTGEEVITVCKVDNSRTIFEQTLILSRPLKFGNVRGENNQTQIGFYPYLVSEMEPEEFQMNGNCVVGYLVEGDIDVALVKEYKNKTSIIELI